LVSRSARPRCACGTLAGAEDAMAGRIEGKVAVVTGAGSGIGRAIATRFAAEGAALVANDVVDDRLASVASALRARGARVETQLGDIGRPAIAEAAAALAIARFGHLDIWVNNAGGGTPSAFEAISEPAYRAELARNLDTTWFGCQAALRVMKPQRRGALINLSSGGALLASDGLHAYSAAKAAILSLTRNLALEYGPHGIRVNAIAPGPILTPVFAEYLKTLLGGGANAGSHVPLGRFGTPEEVAAAALFLASDDASYVSGATLAVDGAITAVLTPPRGA
jgi:meso-butanediol dehydrogenase/(S,S)-butanediol dehydrogenase/diacetyl reductase